MGFLFELRLTPEELEEMARDVNNKCLECETCEEPDCPGYATAIICGDYHSIKSDTEKEEFYKKHNLYLEPKKALDR